MVCPWRLLMTAAVLAGTGVCGEHVARTGAAPPATFKSSVDVVRVRRWCAITRDASSAIWRRAISRCSTPGSETDLRIPHRSGGREHCPAVRRQRQHGVAAWPSAREAAGHVLSWLDDGAGRGGDLHVRHAPGRSDAVHDRTQNAAGVAVVAHAVRRHVAARRDRRDGAGGSAIAEGRRHAVVVLTDGGDNASRLTPAEVSGIASPIDVPVYIFGIVPAIDNPRRTKPHRRRAARRSAGIWPTWRAWTGGHVFVASTPGQRSIAARQIVDELRHQYLIAFESSGAPGWHPLVVRARDKDLTVRARSGYIAGQSRPNSH